MSIKRQSKLTILMLTCVIIGFTIIIYNVAASKDTSSSSEGDSDSISEVSIEIITPTPSPTNTNEQEESQLINDAEFYAPIWGLTVEEAADAIENALTEEEVLIRSAELYANAYNVTVDEAIRRSSLESEIDRLRSDLLKYEDETFAGLWVQHNPEYRILVSFTHDGESTLQSYIQNSQILDYIDVKDVEMSLNDLRKLRNDIQPVFQELDQFIGSYTDINENCIKFHVLDEENVRSTLLEKGMVLPAHVKMVELANPITLHSGDAFAGCSPLANEWPVSPTTGKWTVGWPVFNSDGVKGITTAGHADKGETTATNPTDELFLYTYGTELIFNSDWEKFEQSWDIQWHTVPGVKIRPWLWDGEYTFPIQGQVNRMQQLNDTVWKYGATTGYTYGQVVAYDYLFGDIPNATATWMLVHRDDPDPIECDGDSGAPWASGLYAYGSHSAGDCDNYAVYMAIDYFADIDIELLTLYNDTADSNVTIRVSLQGDNRPIPDGYEIPLTIRFYKSNATWGPSNPPDPDDDTLYYEFTGNATYNSNGGNPVAEYECENIASGTYDITVDSTTTLLNIKDNVVIP